MKQKRKMISLLLALSSAMSLTAVPVMAEGEVSCNGVEFSSGEEVIYAYDENTETVKASTVITNATSEIANPYLFMTVWNGGELVYADAKTEPVPVGEEKTFEIELSEDYLLKSGDVVKTMVWDGMEKMDPLCNPVELTEVFSTNNIADYERTENTTAPGRWSYYAANYNPSLANNDEITLGKAETQFNDNGNWYVGRDWINIIYPNGQILSDATIPMAYVYTVGEEMEGKELVINGSLTGKKASMLVAKTVDTNESELVYGNNIQTITWDRLANFEKEGFKNISNNGNEFEVVIPAEEVKVGNDIIFLVQLEAGWTGADNDAYLDVTVKTSPKKTVYSTYAFADSTYDYTLDTYAATWKYYFDSKTQYETDEYGDSIFAGISKGALMIPGDEGSRFDGKYCWSNGYTEPSRYIDATGFATDGYKMSARYALGDKFLYSEDGIIINARLKPDVVCSASLEIVKANGDGSTELLYTSEICSNEARDITIKLEKGEYSADTEIVFFINEVSGKYWLKNGAYFSIYTASNTSEKEMEHFTSGRANSVEDFTTDKSKATWKYYTTWGSMFVRDDAGNVTGVNLESEMVVGAEGSYYEGMWCRDTNNSNHTNFIGQNNFASDWVPMAWVYTLGDDFKNPENGIRIDAKLKMDAVCRTQLHIVLVNPDGTVKYLHEMNNYEREISTTIELSKDEYQKGSKVIFISSQDNANYWVIYNSHDFTISTY